MESSCVFARSSLRMFVYTLDRVFVLSFVRLLSAGLLFDVILMKSVVV